MKSNEGPYFHGLDANDVLPQRSCWSKSWTKY